MGRDTIVIVQADEIAAYMDMGFQPTLGVRVKEFNIRQFHLVAGHLQVGVRHAAFGVLYKRDEALQVGIQFVKGHELILVV